MTVSSQASTVVFTCNGTTTVFATSPVKFYAAADLDVYKITTADSTAQLLTITTDYAVTGGDASAGEVGTVTTTSAFSSAFKLKIVRVLDIIQSADFVNNDPSDAEVAETALDKLTMMAQQHAEESSRSVKVDPGFVGTFDFEFPNPIGKGGYLLAINSGATEFQLVTAANIAVTAVSPFMATVLDDTTAASARTTLGLGSADSPQFLAVHVGTTDTTLARSGAGDITVAGNAMYRAGGTDVPVADGGTGRSSHTAYAVICGGTTTTAAQQSIASVGTLGHVLTSAGAGALPTFAAKVDLAAEQASTSGTAIDFTGIPAGTRMIVVMLEGVSTNGTVSILVQLGDAGGLEDTGYVNGSARASGGALAGPTDATTGVSLLNAAATRVWHGSLILTLKDATNNTWIGQGSFYSDSGAELAFTAGSKSLSAVLTQVSVLSSTNSFDAGSISIAYQ